MSTATCPFCNYVQTLTNHTLQKLKLKGSRRIRCTRCRKFYYIFLKT